MAARDLATIEKFELARVPVENGDHDEMHALCELVLDNWRNFTDLQRGVAATLHGWRYPAERASQKQLNVMNWCMATAREHGLIQDTA